jgi:hypothetical protein
LSPVPTPVTDHVQQALDELLSRFSEENAPLLRRLLTVLVTRSQEIEDAFQELLTERLLVNAEGVQLDVYGKLVGNIAASRGPLTDDEYRLVIRVAVQVNRSDGNAEQAIQIVAELTQATVHYAGHLPAHYRLEWTTDTPVSADMLQRIELAMPLITASGVSWDLVEGPVGAFQFDVIGFDRGEFAKRLV